MLKSLHIQGFGPFDDLEINHLGAVNLIVGKNGVGKTMLLEAINVFLNPPPESALDELLRSRDVTAAVPEERVIPDRRGLFGPPAESGQDVRGFRISASSDQDVSSLRVMGWELAPEGELRYFRLEGSPNETVIYVGDESSPDTVRVPQRPSRERHRAANEEVVHAPCVMVPAHGFRATELAARWDSIVLTEGEARVIGCLRLVAPIQRLSFIARGPIRVPMVLVENSKGPVPLKWLGGGAMRLFDFATALETASSRGKLQQNSGPSFDHRLGGCLLIDEIENGLHHTALRELWALLFRMSRETGVQVVATTHSKDCLESFELAARESPLEGRVIRLERRDGRYRAVEIDEEDLQIVVEDRIEVR